MAKSNIEWTEATWNPTVGCTKVSAGCKHCYAKTMHARLTKMGQAKYAEPFEMVKPWPDQLRDPLSWTKPRRVFVNSMSDLFHEDLPFDYILKVFEVMHQAKQHTFQVLTKRPERAVEFFLRYGIGDDNEMPPNVWLGVSAENQEAADDRVPLLLQTPAAVRFVSYEPALGPVDFCRIQWPGKHKVDVLRGGAWNFGGFPGFTQHSDMATLDWIIVGGESGAGARPFDIAWARSVVEQCKAAGVACFVKQLGGRPRGWCVSRLHGDDPIDDYEDGHCDIYEASDGPTCSTGCRLMADRKGGDMAEWPEDLRVRQFPEARA